jgi:hypothetical protein
MEAVLGAGAMERCGSMGKSKWAEWVQSTVDVHYRQHWIQRIEAKLAAPLAEAAAPDALVGQVVHKPAAVFDRGGGGVLAGLVTGYNAGRLTWGVEYDDEASHGPEELGAADMRLYGPDVGLRLYAPGAGAGPRGQCRLAACPEVPQAPGGNAGWRHALGIGSSVAGSASAAASLALTTLRSNPLLLSERALAPGGNAG